MHHRFKEVMIIYILINLGVLFTISGSVLYSPAMIPDVTEVSPEDARMDLINSTKGAFIAQDFKIERYNIGFDMMNIGGIFMLIGTLIFNYIIAPTKQKDPKKPSKIIYKLRENGFLKGNIIEWLCLISFLFAFFTFFKNIFFYIIILSFVIGIVGFAVRKLNTLKFNRILKA
jgi:hypothetical protein